MSKKNQATAAVTETEATNVSAPATVVESAIKESYDELLETHKTKSAMIRFLDAAGHKRGTIAKFMGIKYQFVRNVLITPIKKTS